MNSPTPGPGISRRTMIMRGMNITSLSLLAASGVIWWRTTAIREEQNARLRALLGELKIPRSVPDTLSSNPEVLALLEENFEVIAGNSPLEEASIIGIGEVHHAFDARYGNTKEDRKQSFIAANKIADLLGLIVQDEDHVLIEGFDHTRKNIPVLGFIVIEYPWMIQIYKKEISMGGWDDKKTREDASLNIFEGSLLRNERGMIPAMLDAATERPGKTIVVGGAGHFADDPRIDATLEQAQIPYVILGEKTAMAAVRKGRKLIGQ